MFSQIFLIYHKNIQNFYLYLGAVNLIAFILMGMDKNRAKNRSWRIPENILMLVAFIGGSIGILFGMAIYRHKINKNKFTIGIPILYIFNVIVNNLIIYILNILYIF